MRLRHFHAIKTWHGQHGRHPVERSVWDAVLTVWLIGWIGAPTAFIIHAGWAEAACLSVLFLPEVYIGMRRTLHRRRLLRCDWINALG
jgi:hypothetical protein